MAGNVIVGIYEMGKCSWLGVGRKHVGGGGYTMKRIHSLAEMPSGIRAFIFKYLN